MLRGLQIAVVLATLGLWSMQVQAQEGPSGDGGREAAFRAVEGAQVEDVPGGALLIGAYGAAWVLSLAFLWRLGRLHARNQTDLGRLRQALQRDTPER